MSDLAVEAVGFIEKSPYALLITVGKENKPFVREIGPFVNNGLDIYFVTRIDSQKVKHIGINPVIQVADYSKSTRTVKEELPLKK
jgi:general stress protein 26